MRMMMGMGLALLLAGTANASPMIDFRNSDWDPGEGSFDVTFGDGNGMDVTVSSVFGPLYWDTIDGFGIEGVNGEKDEVDAPEVLQVHFSELAMVDGFYTSDFFIESSSVLSDYSEEGSYSTDGGSNWTTFYATNGDPNGEQYVPIGTTATDILFTAPGTTKGDGSNHDFALMGLDAYSNAQFGAQGGPPGPAVPEPGAALLFSAGLLLVGRYSGRRS